MVSTNNQQKNIFWPDLQTFVVETIPCKKRLADVQYLISNFMIRGTEAANCRCSSK